jgi:hypothetical protein
MKSALDSQILEGELDCIVRIYSCIDEFSEKRRYACIMTIYNYTSDSNRHVALDVNNQISIEINSLENELEPNQYWQRSLKWFDSEAEAEREFLYSFLLFKQDKKRFEITKSSERKITFKANKGK